MRGLGRTDARYEQELDERSAVVTNRLTEFFASAGTLNDNYNEQVTEICLKLWERFNQGEAVEFSDEVRSILVDKDALVATLGQSHEHRSAKLFKRNESVTNLYKQKIEQMVTSVRQKDLERNRKRITEISKYFQLVKSAITMMDDSEELND